MDIEHFNDCAERPNVPWNKGKLTGAKPPLRPKHVWAIRTRLQIGGRTRLRTHSGPLADDGGKRET